MNYIYIYAFLTIINIFIIYKFNFISKIYNLYDFPNEKRKDQSKPIPLIGGLIILINFLVFSFIDLYLNKEFFNSIKIFGNINILIFYVSLIFFYIVGYVDDKLDLSPLSKILSSIIILYIFFSSNNDLVINNLNFISLSKNIDLFSFSFPFTILCIIVLINALNMMDGMNLLSASFFIFIFIFFIFLNFSIYASFTFLISILFFITLNYKGRAFLGDNGVFILGFVVSVMLIAFYEKRELNAEYIILLLFLPIIDFIRLAFVRIRNGSSPFLADTNHFHHVLKNKFGYKKTLIIFNSFFYLPSILVFFFKFNVLFTIFLLLTIYFSLIIFMKKL